MDDQWLNTQFRLHPDKTKAGLAAALGLGRPAVSKMLAGGRQIKAQEYLIMRRFFGLPVDGSTATTTGNTHHYVLEPLTDNALSESKSPETEEAWMIPAGLLQTRTRAAPGQVRIFAVQEDAMVPDLRAGEHVLVDLSDRKASPPGIFVVSDGMGHIIRQCEFVPQSHPPSIRLRARNGAYETHILPVEKAGIIGRVIAKLQWL